MLLKINTATQLSTGETAAAPIVELFQEIPRLSQGVIYAEIRAWNSQANKDAGHDHTYLQHAVDDVRSTNIQFAVPQADLDQAATDGHWGVIGTNYPNYMKTALAEIAGCATTDIDILEL